MFKQHHFIIIFAFILTVFFEGVNVSHAYAEEALDGGDEFAKFGKHSEESDWTIDHSSWSELLNATVGVIRPTSRRMTSVQPKARIGTRIPRGSNSPARFEGNRVIFNKLNEDHIQVATQYREIMAFLPNYYPLAYFNKDEQLAYWLNLYNAVLYEQLVKRYPISNLKKMRLGSNDKTSLWDEKLVTVEGVPLSLNDIQNNILIRHWRNPMVLYGLYQGAIGGPSFPNRAFTGKNVHNILKRSAKEFVNSNRGFRMWGSDVQVSLLYEWGRAAFPNWEKDVARHLREYAKSSYKDELANANDYYAKIYDWKIADTSGGTLSIGPIESTAANLLNTRKGNGWTLLRELWRTGSISSGALDPATARLFKGIVESRKFNNLVNPPVGIITSFECGTEDCPIPVIEEEDQNGEREQKDSIL